MALRKQLKNVKIQNAEQLEAVEEEVENEEVVIVVAAFHTPGSHGRNIQATRCVLGGKSRVNVVTLFLNPLFRLNS